MLMRRLAALALVTLFPLAACSSPSPTEADGAPPQSGLRVEVVAGGLEHGWGLGFLPNGTALVTQRSGALALLTDNTAGAQAAPVEADFDDVYAQGEGGLMGLAVHPDFARNRTFVTCQTHQEDGSPVDVRLVKWRLADDGASAERVGEPLLTGIPLNSSGRHSGCRPAVAEDGSLLVSTGDSANPTPPQDRQSLGGKLLRMNIDTGQPPPDNPFADSPNPNERLIYSYGHRNAQGVAVRPGGQVFLSEHGPDIDDEINLVEPGGNYGWDPSRGGTSDDYDESVPMTDLQRFPDAVEAKWSSGEATEAIAGATFLTGNQWGALDGMLAVVALKGSKLMLFRLDDAGEVQELVVPPELDDTHGRLRAAQQGPDGALYVTTSNGSDDKVLRISTQG